MLVSGCGSSTTGATPPFFSFSSWGTGGSEEGRLADPAGFCRTAKNTFLVADTNNHRIQEFDAIGNFIKAWGAQGSSAGLFKYPSAVAVDSSGFIYVCDSFNNRIQKFDEDGNYIAEWGAEGTDDGQFIIPFDIKIDLDDNVYVADGGNDRVQVFSTEGAHRLSFGGAGEEAYNLSGPSGICVSSITGNVYVLDSGNNRIQIFNKNGQLLDTWSGEGRFSGASRITVDDKENVYVVNTGSDQIMKFNREGIYRGAYGSHGNGTGQFNNPLDIIYASDKLYVLDEQNQRVDILSGDLPAVVTEIKKNPESAKNSSGEQTAESLFREENPYSHWMGDIAADLGGKPVYRVTLPGSHDSGTFGISGDSPFAHDGNPNYAQEVIDDINDKLGGWSRIFKPVINWLNGKLDDIQAGWSKSQTLDIGEQLQLGIRYFDLRVSYEADLDGYYIVHSMVSCPLQSVLDDIRDFCRQSENDKEIVILDINHLYNMSAAQENEVAQMVKNTLTFSDGTTSMLHPYVAEGDLESLTFLSMWHDHKSVIVFMTGDVPASDTSFWNRDSVRDEYDATSSLSALQQFIAEELPEIKASYFHILQAILTIDEGTVEDGVESYIWQDYIANAGRVVKWAAGKLWSHEDWSESSPIDLLQFGDYTNSGICSDFWSAWRDGVYAPRIIIINHVYEDALPWMWYDDHNIHMTPDYVNYCKTMNIVF